MKSRHSVSIDEVVIVGGTHGNELLGPYLIRKLELTGRYTNTPLRVNTLLANPKAFDRGVRFIDQDLNRSFSREVLSDNRVHDSKMNYEQQLARKLHQRLSSEQALDRFIIDLHSTTANMGVTLIVRNDQPLNLHAAAYVVQQFPETRILVSDLDRNKSQSLNSISEYGLAVEIGPLAHGVVNQEALEVTEKVIGLLVQFLTLCKTREKPRLPEVVSAFEIRQRVPFPRNNKGELTGMVHKKLQSRDYRLLESGQPIFRTFSEQDIVYKGEALYAVFINEAAYYRENVAFMLSDQIAIPIR